VHTFTTSGSLALSAAGGPQAPSNSVAPVISGSVGIGNTFTCTTGTWIGDATITYTYQWKRNTVNITSATSNSYTTLITDSNSTLTCLVTATNSVGNSSAISNSITLTLPGNINRDPVEIGTTVSSSVLTIKATPDTLDSVESLTTTLANTVSPIVAGVDQNATVSSSVLTIKATPDTLDSVESLTTNLENTIAPVVAGADQNATVSSSVSTSTTYAVTDGNPIVIGATATATNQQYWS
jgi:hypothetical protein